jgi:hypothetical protein
VQLIRLMFIVTEKGREHIAEESDGTNVVEGKCSHWHSGTKYVARTSCHQTLWMDNARHRQNTTFSPSNWGHSSQSFWDPMPLAWTGEGGVDGLVVISSGIFCRCDARQDQKSSAPDDHVGILSFSSAMN